MVIVEDLNEQLNQLKQSLQKKFEELEVYNNIVLDYLDLTNDEQNDGVLTQLIQTHDFDEETKLKIMNITANLQYLRHVFYNNSAPTMEKLIAAKKYQKFLLILEELNSSPSDDYDDFIELYNNDSAPVMDKIIAAKKLLKVLSIFEELNSFAISDDSDSFIE